MVVRRIREHRGARRKEKNFAGSLKQHCSLTGRKEGRKEVARCRSSGPLGALLSSPAGTPALDVRLMTALQVLQEMPLPARPVLCAKRITSEPSTTPHRAISGDPGPARRDLGRSPERFGAMLLFFSPLFPGS